jgi:RHS repeat-associated protein
MRGSRRASPASLLARENGATSGVGVLATLGYDGLGRRTSLTRGNGLVTSYGYDGVSRLASLAHDFVNPGGDVSTTFTRNPAGQIATRTLSNTAYSFPASAVSLTDAHNGLNQITATGGTNVTHDARGNVSVIGTAGYQYTSENQLRAGPGAAQLAYDVMGRLYFAGISAPWTYLGYEGERQIAEYDSWGGVLRRYVHGPGTDEPLVWYEGAGTSDRRWLHADERGSIVAVSAGSGGSEAIIRYDEYGRPHGPAGAGTMPTRFGYTGQAWLPEIGMWYYKARIFNSALGRFMQSDPSGYADGPNIYGYVRGDPINLKDPSGLHGRGSGFTDGQWRMFDEAQRRLADRLAERAAALDAAMAAGGDSLEQAQGAFEDIYGEGSGTLRNMSMVSGVMKNLVTALRDDGSSGYFATGLNQRDYTAAAQIARVNTQSAAFAGRRPGITINVDLFPFSAGRGTSWAIGHETGHNFGLAHPRVNGSTPYALGGTVEERRAYRNLSVDAALVNPDKILEYGYGPVPN